MKDIDSVYGIKEEYRNGLKMWNGWQFFKIFLGNSGLKGRLRHTVSKNNKISKFSFSPI